jgi:hypothetical protein
VITFIMAAATNFTSEPWFPGFVTGGLALIGVLAAASIQSAREKRKDKAALKTPEPPTTQQVWERLDRVEKALRSSVAILGEVAEQWPLDHPPVLSRKHVGVLAEAGYMPPEWEPETTNE